VKKDYGTGISSGASGGYVAEGGNMPTSEPTFPGRQGCKCLSPRIYDSGKILDVCERCGLPFGKKRLT
jgi:hypothetical protein